MGNTNGIPASSNDEWVVINIPRTCAMSLGGKIHIPLDHDVDERLVDTSSPFMSRSGASGGLVPKNEYDDKIREFNSKIGGGRMKMMLLLWITILFLAIVPQCMRIFMKDAEIWMYFVLAYVPMIFSLGYMFWFLASERKNVKALFEPWESRYGIETRWFQGRKHQAPILGFKLPTTPAV